MEKKKVIFFTGAGISAESGIKTFRDGDGLWENYRVEDVAHIDGWRRDKETVLKFYNERRAQLPSVFPNIAHEAIGALETDERFEVHIITQNVDNLHERAGSTDIIHLHGELVKSRSTANHKNIFDCPGDINVGDKCPEGSQLRPHIVWFGENLNPYDLKRATELTQYADFFVIVGTSMQVQPAASIPFMTPHKTPIFYVDPNGLDTDVIPQNRREFFKHVMANATTGIPRVIERIKEMTNEK